MKYTSNYNLKKPEGTDVVNIDDLNDNADILDQKLKEVENKADSAPPNSVNDAAIGSRTPDQSQAPASPGTGTLTQLISWLANRIKAITGKTNWWDAPPTTLQAAKTHMDAAAPHSGHETPSGAQTKANAAEANAKGYTDTHAGTKNTHGVGSGYYIAKTSRSDQLPAWNDVQGKPSNFTPSAHKSTHASGGSDALTPSDIGAETPAGAQAKVDAHANLTNNPHSVTKSQVGLGSVSNYGLATQAEAEAGTSSAKYMTPLRTKQAIDALQAVKSVAGKTGAVTVSKSDVGLGNVDNVKQASKTEFDAHKAEEATESEYGHVRLSDLPKGKRVARFVIGTSTAGWTATDCDYLCDGTADQEEIIQALNALPATGGEIVILDGTYNITASINIPKDNISIRGNGNATILKRMYDSTNADSGSTARGVITLSEKSGCKIQGLQIDGNKATYTAYYNDGIYLRNSSNNTITGNTCNSNNSDGIRLYSSSSNIITGNTCKDNNNYPIYLVSSSSNNIITGNTCNDNSDGIYLSSSSSYNIITDNTCNDNHYGIHLKDLSNNNTVIGNSCNNNNYGIALSSFISDMATRNNTVTGNTCNNNNYGIYLDKSIGNTVTGNTCNDNTYGIHLDDSISNTVTGNTCIRGTGASEDYAPFQHTIRLYDTGNDYNLISSNNCMGKAVTIEGGTGNSAWGNKYDSGDDLPI